MKALALLILIGGLFLARRRLLMGLRSSSWPDTPGTVVRAGQVFSGYDDSGDSTWDVNLAYTYVVDGREYRGNTIEALPSVLGDEQVRRVTERYPPGTTVTVYYDPRHPESSVIVPGLSRFAMAGLLVYVGTCLALTVSLFIRS